jgi:hypothetical protein
VIRQQATGTFRWLGWLFGSVFGGIGRLVGGRRRRKPVPAFNAAEMRSEGPEGEGEPRPHREAAE